MAAPWVLGRALVCLLALTVAVAPTMAAAKAPLELSKKRAHEHFAKGQAAWLAEDYETAQRELEFAHEIENDPELLYALAQLARVQDDCARARELYLEYLESEPATDQAQDALINIERCNSQEFQEPPDPGGSRRPLPPELVEPADAHAPPDRLETRLNRPDVLGVTLSSVGAGLLTGGVIAVGVSFSLRAQAGEVLERSDFERRLRASKVAFGTGWTLVGVGASLLVGGIVRLSLQRRNRASRKSDARANR